MRLRLYEALGCVCLLAACAVAQNSASDAASAINSGDYPKAISIYESLAKQNPSDSNIWEQLGLAYHQSGKYADAIRCFQKAIDKGLEAPVGRYNLAAAYARAGQKQQSLDILADLTSKDIGLPFFSDSDFDSLKSEPRYQEIAATAQALLEPCKDTQRHPEFRQLDFWVGDWDVYSGKQKAGENLIELTLKDCVVVENWSGAQGDHGKSYNKWNPQKKEWEQFWVDDSGSTRYFEGQAVDGEMHWTTQFTARDGRPGTRRIVLSKLGPDKVRQLSEATLDGGKTWVTVYDFVYVRKGSARQ